MAACEANVAAILKGLEKDLLNPRIRKNERRLLELLAEEFREFGSSGRTYTRAQVIAMLADESAAKIALDDLVTERLADECVLVTYRARRYEGGSIVWESLRSSIWVWREERWQMVFHQGTRVSAS